MREVFFLTMSLLILAVLAGCGDGASSATDSGTPADDANVDSGTLVDSGLDSDSGAADDAGPASDAGAADDAGPASDAGAADDASPPSDSGAADDAGPASDAGASTDGGGSTGCAPGTAIPDHLAGVCDGRGRAGCVMWATTNGGASATAQCTPPAGRCARADVCSSAGCTCGGGPECADDQMCALAGSAGYSCVCISP